MLTETIQDPRSWNADTIDDASGWYGTLSSDCLQVLDDVVRTLRGHPRPVQEIRLTESLREACTQCLDPVRRDLVGGRGFAIVEGIPMDAYSLEEALAAYWTLGQCLGNPFAQNIQGTVLYDVRDTGRDVKEGARFSVTNAESSFHTDNAFGAQVPSIVGLLCVRTARSGGASQLISAYALHNRLLETHPEALEGLYEPFYFDRRGQVQPGENSFRPAPVFRWDGEDLRMRYMNYYIHVGHEKASQPLTASQAAGLEALEGALKPGLHAEFGLEPGQMLFVNNNWILHNRTAFEDEPEFERRRHYVWLNPGP